MTYERKNVSVKRKNEISNEEYKSKVLEKGTAHSIGNALGVSKTTMYSRFKSEGGTAITKEMVLAIGALVIEE